MGGVSYCCSSAQNTHEKWLERPRRQPDDDMLTPPGYPPPPHTAADMAHSTHSTQPARPHRTTHGQKTNPRRRADPTQTVYAHPFQHFYLTPKKAFIFAKKPFGSGAGACGGGGGPTPPKHDICRDLYDVWHTKGGSVGVVYCATVVQY